MSDDERTICERCQKPMEAECGGRGYVFDVERDVTGLCPNVRARSVRDSLGPEIAAVEYIRNSPLYLLSPEGGPPEADRTQDNLVIYCPWVDLLPHLKWALGLKIHAHPTFFFRVVTDGRIKNVFVGDEAYKSRDIRRRDDGSSYNNLRDFAEDPDLLIVKLGYLGYKNIAAAGALKEALLLRESAGKPTWLVRDADHPWTHSKDPDVRHFVDLHFEKIKLGDEDVGMSVEEDEDYNPAPDFEELEDNQPEAPAPVFDDDEEDEPGGIPDFELPGDDEPGWKKRGGW